VLSCCPGDAEPAEAPARSAHRSCHGCRRPFLVTG
jgi:hypothetical protein